MARILRGAGLTGWRWPLALALSLVLGVAEVGQAQPESGGERRPQQGMLRYPDVSATHLVFVYANDLWIVPREGGLASPLASPPGAELFPRFSPSGEKVAFMGNYGGGPDLYSIEVGGGVPQRLTHHPSREWLCDWTPDGKELLYHTSGYAGAPGAEQLFTVSSHGGTPKRLPPLHAANGALSPDQKRLVFTPHTRDHSTWKRYMGGLATNLWLFELETGEARRITEWAGTDSQPMWHEGTIYYLSDRGKAHRLNIWAYDTGKDTHEQITAFADHDARWPSLGPGPTGKGEIVFQLGNELRLLDLETRKDRGIDVRVPGARPRLLPQTLEVSELVTWWSASPTGANAVIEARGELFLFPLRGEGVPQNLTRSSGAADRYPVWSPGGGYVAFVSDRSGEYELYLLELGGDRELIQLTEGSSTYYFAPVFSPSGDRLAYADKTGTIRIVDVVTKKVTEVDREPFAEEPHLSFSHDGSWLAYDKTGDSLLRAIWLYHIPSG
ncbi:MAG: S41 family peptidase, partial [Planctomycetota bacterium]